MPPNKFHAQAVTVNNIRFASHAEARRYQMLWMLQQAGEIGNLELQPRYDLLIGERRIGFYKADFRYRVVATGETVIEDVKGVRTPVYKLKKKLVEALYQIEIREVA